MLRRGYYSNTTVANTNTPSLAWSPATLFRGYYSNVFYWLPVMSATLTMYIAHDGLALHRARVGFRYTGVRSGMSNVLQTSCDRTRRPE